MFLYKRLPVFIWVSRKGCAVYFNHSHVDFWFDTDCWQVGCERDSDGDLWAQLGPLEVFVCVDEARARGLVEDVVD